MVSEDGIDHHSNGRPSARSKAKHHEQQMAHAKLQNSNLKKRKSHKHTSRKATTAIAQTSITTESARAHTIKRSGTIALTIITIICLINLIIINNDHTNTTYDTFQRANTCLDRHMLFEKHDHKATVHRVAIIQAVIMAIIYATINHRSTKHICKRCAYRAIIKLAHMHWRITHVFHVIAWRARIITAAYIMLLNFLALSCRIKSSSLLFMVIPHSVLRRIVPCVYTRAATYITSIDQSIQSIQ